MHERVTTALDVLGLLLVAAGIGAWVSVWIGWAALSVSGVLVLAGSGFAAWSARRTGRAPS